MLCINLFLHPQWDCCLIWPDWCSLKNFSHNFWLSKNVFLTNALKQSSNSHLAWQKCLDSSWRLYKADNLTLFKQSAHVIFFLAIFNDLGLNGFLFPPALVWLITNNPGSDILKYWMVAFYTLCWGQKALQMTGKRNVEVRGEEMCVRCVFKNLSGAVLLFSLLRKQYIDYLNCTVTF